LRGLGRGRAWIARLAVAWLLVLATGGCYETRYQVFSREDAVLIPGLEGRYLAGNENSKVARYTISRARDGNDYRLHCEGTTNNGCTKAEYGVFRAVSVAENLYIMQLRLRSEKRDETGRYQHAFLHEFFRVVRSADTIVRIEPLTATRTIGMAIARSDGVDQWGDRPVGLSGSPVALKRFLLDMGARATEFFKTEGVVYTRIP